MMFKEVVQVPLPESLVPQALKRNLVTSVRKTVYELWRDPMFQKLVGSTGNKDSVNENRMFDRRDAVTMVMAIAQKNKDQVVLDATPGRVYQALVYVLRGHGITLRLRRTQYKQLTAAAE